jgi:hypothetical protein
MPAVLLWLSFPAIASAQVGISVDVGVGGGVSVGSGDPGGPGGSVGESLEPPNAGLGLEDVRPLATDKPLSQDAALEAVRSKRAVPLAPIVEGLRAERLQVVDAQLLSLRGILVYELRTIGDTGEVSEIYFYARSGKRVEVD